MAGTKGISVDTPYENWICSHLSNTTRGSEYKLSGRTEENTAPALLIPPGLDAPYFQVKCSLLPFSAFWSSPAISLSIISSLPCFLERRWRELWGATRWSDLIHIKSGLTEDNSSSDFLLIRLRAAQQQSRARGAHEPHNRQSESAIGHAEIMSRLCHASIWVVVLSWYKAAHAHMKKTQCSMHEHSNTILNYTELFLHKCSLLWHLLLQCFMDFKFEVQRTQEVIRQKASTGRGVKKFGDE